MQVTINETVETRLRKFLAEEHAREHDYPERQEAIERGIDADVPLRVCLAAMRRAYALGIEHAY